MTATAKVAAGEPAASPGSASPGSPSREAPREQLHSLESAEGVYTWLVVLAVLVLLGLGLVLLLA